MTRKYFASVLGAMTLLLAAGAATAAAASPGVQVAGQSADSAQQATSASGATQIDPSNTNISVRVLSPGNDGPVTQSNTATSDASSTNSNSTTQDADQAQSAGGIQATQQLTGNAQDAEALSHAYQSGATNYNIGVRVLSPGSDGAVTQSNDASSSAQSTNTNTTNQSSDQDQSGTSSCGCAPVTTTVPSCGCEPAAAPAVDAPAGQTEVGSGSSPDVQSSDQEAENIQLAGAASSATQIDPQNVNSSVRVLSPGNDGSVSQSNSDSSTATASNANTTDQTSDQDQYAGKGSCGCSSPTDVQFADQSAGNLQVAGAASEATQIGAENVNLPVRVLSPGSNGSVDQSNSVESTADSTNTNTTRQKSDQDQTGRGCGCASSDPIQIAEQSSGSYQGAAALSAAGQFGAKNDNSPVRVGSGGYDGSVTQSNSDTSDASASNTNSTKQTADQDQSSPSRECGCHDGIGIQVLGQQSENGQVALSASGAFQDFGKSECGCSSGGNSNDPVRVWSPGSDGSVSQSNSAESTADSTNSNTVWQDGHQSQSGGSGIEIQALGQQAESGQLATALSGTFQLDPSNRNGETRVFSPGHGGSVDQSNDASSSATADNTNRTTQKATQRQHGSGGCGCGGGLQIQALGQSAGNLQAASAYSTVLQWAPKNANRGTAVWSPSKKGVKEKPGKSKGPATMQDNTASSTGVGANHNVLSQYAKQMQ